MPEKEANKQDRHLAENRKARFEYFIDETVEAGIVLTGTEVKSCRLGHISLQDGFARIENGEVWLHSVHVSPYEQGNRNNHEPRRQRKLLLHKSEILRLRSAVREKGLTLVPLRCYLKSGKIKVLVAVARGKKLWDKRESIAERESKREIERAMRSRW